MSYICIKSKQGRQMAISINSLDNISETMLDFIKKKFDNNPNFRIIDDRKTISFGKPKEYFLFANNSANGLRANLEFTFIWIGGNLWQFSYCNTECLTKPSWKNPLDLLNELLNQ